MIARPMQVAQADEVIDRWERGEPIHEIAAVLHTRQGAVADIVNRHEAEKAGLEFNAAVPWAAFAEVIE